MAVMMVLMLVVLVAAGPVGHHMGSHESPGMITQSPARDAAKSDPRKIGRLPRLQKRNPGVIGLSLSGFHTQISITPVLHLSEGPPQTAIDLMVY